MGRFVLSSKAESDIDEITSFIARDDVTTALKFARALRSKISEIAENPHLYRERVELRPTIRAARHGRYLIFFCIHEEVVQILRVWHSARNLDEMLDFD